jgi:chromate transporter
MSPVLLFLLFLKSSALSFGGLGGVPTLHQDLVNLHVPDVDNLFGQALAVGRLSPGPNGLYLVSLGYLMGGLIGGVAAGVALALPPFVVLIIAIGYARVAHLQRTANALVVLSFALTGLLGFTSWQIMTSSSSDVFEWAAGVLGFLVSVRFRFNPLAIIGVAAALGIIIYR